MSGPEPCRGLRLELWAAWPDPGAAPAGFAEHARSCPECMSELGAFQSLCARAARPEGGPLSWSSAMPRARLARLKARTLSALSPKRRLNLLPALVPAAALAALAVFMNRPAPISPPIPDPPAEVLENLEFYERLGFLEAWDAPASEGRRQRSRRPWSAEVLLARGGPR